MCVSFLLLLRVFSIVLFTMSIGFYSSGDQTFDKITDHGFSNVFNRGSQIFSEEYLPRSRVHYALACPLCVATVQASRRKQLKQWV